ncbi:MAG: response regulator [Treponema sp.]|nr:response regulator [Treponema sp.]
MIKQNISVVIVDDDDIARKFFGEKIDWSARGYELAGMAEDGIAGLDLIEELEPDVVITDILMPCMDGLTMLKELKTRGLHPRTIILSGHDEFEYARTAISLSVDAYINKPLDEEGLFEVLNQTKERLENERRFASHINESLPLLRQVFLSRLFSGYYHDADAIQEQAAYLGISLGEGPFLCAAGGLDSFCQEIRKRSTQGKEFIKASVLKIAAEALEGFCRVYFCDTGETGFAMLLVTNKNKAEDTIAIISRQLEEIIRLCRIRFNVPLTLGLSSLCENTVSIALAWQEALKALSCEHLFGTGRIISIRDINLSKNTNSWEMQDVANELAKAVRVADMNLVDEQLTRLYHQITAGTNVSMIRIRMDAGAMVFAIINEADSWLKKDRFEAHDAFAKVYAEIQQLGTIEDILKVLKNFAFTIIGLIEETRQSHHKTILHKAVVYIESNFQNPALSLEQTAAAAGVSQSHLSFLFKKKMQSSFHKYTTRMRIEKAKLLLKENDFKTYEVAEMAGFSNAQYFSVSFKKYTGVSPLQFRNTMEAIK